ncbi:MAG: hypothetical protein P4L42_08885 [Desulfocapsaceae bacterium]|nr:hypothetical protein [Desulfocapsaceae bacterium]
MQRPKGCESEKKRANPGLRRGLLPALIMVQILLVPYALSGLGRMDSGTVMAAEEESRAPEAGGQDRDRDITADGKDLDRLYKELLTGKKKETEPKTIMKAGKDGYYRVLLVNGGTLRARTIEIGKDIVILTDDRGMRYTVPRGEIYGIEEKDGREEGGYGK